MNQERPIIVCPGRQRSRHQTRQRAECAPLAAGRQAQRAEHESWPQLQSRIKRPQRNIRSGNHRLAQKAHRERCKRGESQPRSSRREEPQTGPCGGRHGGKPNRKIGKRPTGNHEPEAKEERRPRHSNPHNARRGVIRRRVHEANPSSMRDATRDREPRNDLREIWPCFCRCGSASEISMSALRRGQSYHVPRNRGSIGFVALPRREREVLAPQGIVRPLLLFSATWSSRQREARGAFGPQDRSFPRPRERPRRPRSCEGSRRKARANEALIVSILASRGQW